MNVKKKLFLASMATVISINLAACGSTETTSQSDTKQETNAKDKEKTEAKQETREITYLDKTYTVPTNVKKIAAASLESMEDAAVLGVKPVGTITVGGELPSYLAKELQGAESLGEKMQPNYETILSLKPDVIFWTSKSPENVTQQLEKLGPTFPYSHISTNWEANLRLMAELTGKEDKAEKIISDYTKNAQETKAKIGDQLTDKKVIVARVRNGNLNLYPQDVYLNPVLYNDLGIAVPEEIKSVKAQEMISVEQMAKMNPDYIFLQFAESENANQPKGLEELENNPIWKSMNAAKNDKIFVNSVDPLAQGGTAWSKTKFLEAASKDLTK
ncbi:iron-uptake system-binding protein [Bacillus sp. VT 712]|jgi:iron complex transport system substrate-binding protein|uniref:Iron-uptake system-binding protein n=1 Tax=Priestia veravalensis TaxID=1414648 RepID=A0A0V8JNG9_9BACI|nr:MULTISPECIES: ABC transporter substrate-binding protein [Bacillaceae]KSU88597.1 iron-uptake system-binding protein [Priestia veravalensis]KZB91939.1 iron-uptake system-binding protein [Bacillus sp. VT 712]MCA0965802.1 ABC transporter substrate-binding protein [Priestia flexa]SCC08845.1 iron complex transport system substrate-binding protein [Priestia flexa]